MALTLVALLAFAVRPASAAQRPFSDFLSTQGLRSDYIPPAPDEIGWLPRVDFSAPVVPPFPFALVDYAGVGAKWILANGGPDLGTQVSGSVNEIPLKDGTAQVTIIVHARNALTWVALANLPGVDFADSPLLFGARAPDVLAGAVPVLGNADLKWVYIANAPGAPIPDISHSSPLDDPNSSDIADIGLEFHSSASGYLHALAGMGPDGTPAEAIVDQVGLLGRGSTTNGHLTFDRFAVERVDLHPTGK